MYWNIYLYGKFVNTIYATEDFVREYCEANDFTYELRPEPEYPQPAEELTVWDELDRAYREGVDSAYDQ